MSAPASTVAGHHPAPSNPVVRAAAITGVGTGPVRNDPLSAHAPDRWHGRDGAHDFDFLFGRWRVHNERLRQRLCGSTDWQRFEAIVECRPILGGTGNIDEFVTDEFEPTVFLGMTLRLFDRATQRWSIWWASNRSGTLEPPVTGGFEGGTGRFEGDDVHDGKPVRVRFLWSVIDAQQAAWEQAFSSDDGRTWETNWRMHLSRLDRLATTAGEGA